MQDYSSPSSISAYGKTWYYTFGSYAEKSKYTITVPTGVSNQTNVTNSSIYNWVRKTIGLD